MKKIINFILIFVCTLLSSCSPKYKWVHIEVKTEYNNYKESYELMYKFLNYVSESNINKNYYVAGIDYEKYNLNDIMVGDVLKVKTDIVFSSIIIPNGAEFNTVKSLRVKRAKRIDFEVILNSNNKKEIICLEKKYNFIESYTNENQIIFTNLEKMSPSSTYHLKYSYVTLNELDLSTKLIATVYEINEKCFLKIKANQTPQNFFR